MNSRKRFYEYYQKVNSFIVCNNVAQVIEGNFNRDNESNVVSTIMPFSYDDMKLLVTAYDGYSQLLDEVERIFEIRPQGGCFSDLESIKTLIQNLSPLYIEGISWEKQELSQILDDSSLSLDEAAERLMGGV